MPVEAPTGKEPRGQLADWVELSALANASSGSGAAQLRRLLSREAPRDHIRTRDGDETLEEEQLESVPDAVEQAVVDELQSRESILGEAYPFGLVVSRNTWTLKWRGFSESRGREAYLVCLFISGMRDKRLSEERLRSVSVAPAKVFQSLANTVARRYFGQGTSFGWPRPDGTSFRDALANFASDFGVGVAKTEHPPASKRAEKDEGIDVIAWKCFPDGRPGQLLMFGQVASGGNWRGKAVQPEIDKILDWFSTRPSRHAVPAMFIPFLQHHDFEPVHGVSWVDALIDHCRENERDYGLMFDRLRIAALMEDGPLLIDATAWVSGGVAEARRSA